MGAVSSVLAGFFFWIPKITGWVYDFFLADLIFFIFFLGVNITFFPMHFLGFAGMPRRIPDYPDTYSHWNHIASFGSLVSVVSFLLLVCLIWDLFYTQNSLNKKSSWTVNNSFIIIKNNLLNSNLEKLKIFEINNNTVFNEPGNYFMENLINLHHDIFFF
jgi:hypothetical protein